MSVIILMYELKSNKEVFCSVDPQTYIYFECLIIDDCWPDNSYEIARCFVENYSLDHLFNRTQQI